jgi:hypothetical protein
MKTGFQTIDRKFSVLAVSNTTIILAGMGFMAFLFRG